MSERLSAPQISQEAYNPSHIVVLNNTHSKNAAIANERIAALKQLYPAEGQVYVLPSDPDIAVTRALMLEELTARLAKKQRPVFAIAGGDGTVNVAIQTIASSAAPDVIRQCIPIVPLGTGNANDLARMLYLKPANMKANFKTGREIEIPLLQYLVVPPGKDPTDPEVLRIAERRVAASYISFGASARGAHVLNNPKVRKHAQHKEGERRSIHHRITDLYYDSLPDILALQAGLQAPPFHIVKDGKKHRIREVLFGNGDRAAKLGRMPAQLDKHELYTAMVRDRRFGRAALVLGAAQMMVGMMPGKMLGEQASYTFQVLEDVPVQYDGETSKILAGSTIIVSHAEVAIRALTTKL